MIYFAEPFEQLCALITFFPRGTLRVVHYSEKTKGIASEEVAGHDISR